MGVPNKLVFPKQFPTTLVTWPALLKFRLPPGVAGFSDVALEATKEQEALAVAFLTKCTVGDTVLDAYDAMHEQETKCRAFLSVAESAIQQASGRNKPVDCWGCGGNHFWNQCPKKSNPETCRRVNQLLKDKFGDCRKPKSTNLAAHALLAEGKGSSSVPMNWPGNFRTLGFD